MRDENDLFTERPASSGELLSELGSIKELLDEELQQERAPAATAIDEIGSVEEYLRLKQAAGEAGLSIEAYLASQKQALESEVELELLDEYDDDTLPMLDEVVTIEEEGEEEDASDQGGDALLLELAEEEEHAPSTAAATTVEEYFAAVVAAKHKAHTPAATSLPAAAVTPDEERIPLLDEVITSEEAIPVLTDTSSNPSVSAEEQAMSLDEVQELVDLLVNRKLQHIKPQLEREVMSELQKLLPIATLQDP